MAKKNHKDYDRIYAKDRQEWRNWLEENHQTAPGVWLIYFKSHTDKPRVPYDDAVEEALCFGWIDSKPNKIDEDSYMQLFTPRKAKSVWSKLNKERIEKLLEQDLIAPAGLEAIEVAKQNGYWAILDPIENLEIPDDLAKALKANPAAEENFTNFADTYKKGILWWIVSAKRPETRSKRIQEAVEMAAENLKAQFDKRLE